MKPGKIISSIIIISLMIVIVSVIAGVFIMGMGCGCVSKSYNIAATAHRTGSDSIVITYQGGPDVDQVKTNDSFIVQINDKNATDANAIKQSGLSATLNPGRLENTADSTIEITGSDIANPAHVIVIATFKDGSQQVILDTKV